MVHLASRCNCYARTTYVRQQPYRTYYCYHFYSFKYREQCTTMYLKYHSDTVTQCVVVVSTENDCCERNIVKMPQKYLFI
jgi:hypothetical protein